MRRRSDVLLSRADRSVNLPARRAASIDATCSTLEGSARSIGRPTIATTAVESERRIELIPDEPSTALSASPASRPGPRWPTRRPTRRDRPGAGDRVADSDIVVFPGALRHRLHLRRPVRPVGAAGSRHRGPSAGSPERRPAGRSWWSSARRSRSATACSTAPW